jgi:flagellar basal-body rod protein FlgG
MANGLQIAASSLIAQQWHLDAVANDIANVSTVGYRQTRAAFTELLGQSGGVRASSAGATSAMGALAESDNPLAVALDGPGFIQVRTAAGAVALSRHGDLRLDDARNLVVDGARVEPPVTIPADVDEKSISIGRDGTVSAAGKEVGKLTLVDVPAPDGLADLGNGLFATTSASGAATAAAGSTVQQGFLEQSNVDLAEAITEMMDAQRGFQLASRAIHTQDQLLEIANGIRR